MSTVQPNRINKKENVNKNNNTIQDHVRDDNHREGTRVQIAQNLTNFQVLYDFTSYVDNK